MTCSLQGIQQFGGVKAAAAGEPTLEKRGKPGTGQSCQTQQFSSSGVRFKRSFKMFESLKRHCFKIIFSSTFAGKS